jgi:DinB superfamily
MASGKPFCGNSSALRSTCSKTRCAPVPTTSGATLRKSRHGARRALWGFGTSYTTRSSGSILFIGVGQGFLPPAPFTLDELDPSGLLPERPYTKDELQRYLDHGREKCRAAIEALTDEKARARRRISSGEVNGAELLLYSMRHVQHHAAQLNSASPADGRFGASVGC